MTIRRRPGALLAAVTCAASCIVCVRHTLLDAAAPSFDEAWYLEVSFKLWHALCAGRLFGFAGEYASAFRFKAPLVSIIPLPLYALFGPSYDAAVLGNLPALALLALSLYGLGRHFFSEVAGGLAAAFALAFPLNAALSRLLFVETWLAALTAAFLWRWAASENLHRPAEAGRLGGLLGLGLLSKVTFPLPLAGPLTLGLWEGSRPQERPLKVLCAVAGIVALTWYGPNLVYVAGYSFRASFGDIAAHYASASPWGPATLARFLSVLWREGLGYPAAILLATSLILLGRRVWTESGMRFALAWFLPPVLLVAASRSKDLRFTAAALPGAALALGGALDILTRERRGRVAILGLAAALSWSGFTLQAAGWAPALARSAYGGAPRPAPAWDTETLARTLARTAGPGAVVVIGSEHGQLNANLLSAWAARDRLPIAFIHYGHMEDRVENVLARLSDKGASHILFVDGLPAGELPPMVPGVDAALRELIRRGRLPFRSLGPVPLDGNLTAELWERAGPIRMIGAPH